MATLTDKERTRVANKINRLYSSIERNELRLDRIGSNHEDSKELEEMNSRMSYALYYIEGILETIGYKVEYGREEDEQGNMSYPVKLIEQVKH